MSIQSEITRILTKRDESFEAVEGKGVTVPSGSTIDDLPGLIALIPTGGGGGMTVIETTDSHGGTIVTITGEEVVLQSKSVTPTTSSQLINPDDGYTGLASVNVGAIPSQYIVPTGTTNITSNGTYDVTQYASASISVSGGTVNIQTNKNATPTESTQIISPDTGYDALAQVTISAVSSDYIGSNITVDPTPTVSEQTVTIPAGYYSAQTTKSVATATKATPGITVNTAGLITASYTQTAGYVTAGTVSSTSQLTVQAAKTITPSTTSQTAVSAYRYTTGVVTVAAIQTETSSITPTTTAQTINPSTGKYFSQVTVAAIPAQYKDVSSVTASAADILSGKVAISSTGATLNGSLVVQHYYTGSGTPDASTGSNGDIYLKTS